MRIVGSLDSTQDLLVVPIHPKVWDRANEASKLRRASGLVLAKLSELLFVEALHRYINALPSDQTGWLARA